MPLPLVWPCLLYTCAHTQAAAVARACLDSTNAAANTLAGQPMLAVVVRGVGCRAAVEAAVGPADYCAARNDAPRSLRALYGSPTAPVRAALGASKCVWWSSCDAHETLGPRHAP
jgi:hypothetical protein